MSAAIPPPQPPEIDDPFFRLTASSEWNACIGPQATDANYVDGYIEAAMELAGAVIDKKMYDKRDTLVMPILYNARHALEISLKFVIHRLNKMGVLKTPHPKDHDILSHWTLLDDSPVGDVALRQQVAALKPYVTSLSRIDDDGQELRYSTRRDGQRSLATRPLANIAVIRSSLGALNDTMASLQYRVLDLAQERRTGSFTDECSRRDLLEIARMLPPKSAWRDPAFDEAKAAVRERFNLSGRKFSAAVDVIKRSREMRLLIGCETDLVHLSDQDARFAVVQSSKRHALRRPSNDLGTDLRADRDWDAMQKQARVAAEVNAAIVAELTPDTIADLETIFYLGRDKQFCEHYEQQLATTREEHRAANNLTLEVNHLMEKTNFLDAFALGVAKLGRPKLAEELRALTPP